MRKWKKGKRKATEINYKEKWHGIEKKNHYWKFKKIKRKHFGKPIETNDEGTREQNSMRENSLDNEMKRKTRKKLKRNWKRSNNYQKKLWKYQKK